MHTFLTMTIEKSVCFILGEPIFFFNHSYVVHTEYNKFFPINWTLRMSDNLPERVQILCHVHIICITVLENRIICCQIFCDLLLKSAFEWIFNVMQLILVKIKWHIKWKYLIKKFHDISLSYYFKILCFIYKYEAKHLGERWDLLSAYTFVCRLQIYFIFYDTLILYLSCIKNALAHRR
jgi:hypothetical protein